MPIKKKASPTPQLNEETPVGFKWVVGYIVYNILGAGLIFTYGDVFGLNYEEVPIFIQMVGYMLVLYGLLKKSEMGRLFTILYLFGIMAYQIVIIQHSRFFGLIFSGMVIYYLTKPEVIKIFKNP